MATESDFVIERNYQPNNGNDNVNGNGKGDKLRILFVIMISLILILNAYFGFRFINSIEDGKMQSNIDQPITINPQTNNSVNNQYQFSPNTQNTYNFTNIFDFKPIIYINCSS